MPTTEPDQKKLKRKRRVQTDLEHVATMAAGVSGHSYGCQCASCAASRRALLAAGYWRLCYG